MKSSELEYEQPQKVMPVKKCPHCGTDFSFLKFLTRCGSDTLIAHPTASGFHRREHRCAQCRKLFWLEYHHQALQEEFGKYSGLLIGLGVGTFLAAYLFWKMGLFAAISLTAIAMFLVWPILMSWIKYESAEIKGE